MSKNSLDERKLIGRIGIQEEWGPIIGFWATTFDFNPEFFETDYLPSLLNLGSWDDRHWTSRIILEKELAKMESATIMMDPHRYQGRPRSMRVALLPGRGQHSKLHAKVMIVYHENAVRLLVGSANITEQGYRSNIEIVANYVVTKKNPIYAPLLKSALQSSKTHLIAWRSKPVDDLIARSIKWLDTLESGNKVDNLTTFAWSSGSAPLWNQILGRWGNEPINKITITSPFWSEEAGSGPLLVVVKKLQERNILSDNAEVLLVTEGISNAKDEWRPILPNSYGSHDFTKLGIRCYAQSVDPSVSIEEAGGIENTFVRKLHAKVFMLEGTNTTLAYMGSANFTHKGWGTVNVSQFANIEAGIIVVRQGKERTELSGIVPPVVGQRIELDGTKGNDLAEPPKQEESMPWPNFIHDIYLESSKKDVNELELVVKTELASIQGPWKIAYAKKDDGGEQKTLIAYDGVTLHDEFVTRSLNAVELYRLMIDQEVWVSWWDCPAGLNYPVNVSEGARERLPVSPDSKGPNEQTLLSYYQGRIPYEELYPPVDPGSLVKGGDDANPDSPSVVDVSQIQSYQIREFVESLDGIREDLKLASGSERTMKLALCGPVSPIALAFMVVNKVKEKKRTPMAAGFQLVELLACVMSLNEEEGHDLWAEHQERAKIEITAMLNALRKEYTSELGPTSNFAKYERGVLKVAS